MTMMMSREKMQMWKGKEAIIIGVRNLKLFLKFILLSFLYLTLICIIIMLLLVNDINFRSKFRIHIFLQYR